MKKKVIDQKNKEMKTLSFWDLLKLTSPLVNLVTITSYLHPRHMRLTLLMLNVYIHFLASAVYFFIMRDEPSLKSDSRAFQSMQGSGMLIAFLASVSAGLLMYMYYALFKISDIRIRIAKTTKQLDYMLYELKKESGMKLLLAYFLAICTITVTWWFVVTFSADYGWSNSLEWLQISIVAIILDLIAFDLVTVLI